MAGTLVNLVRKQQYKLQGSGTTDTVMVPLIDTLNLTSGVLIIRVYALALTGTLSIAMKNVMMGPDDPATILSGSDVVVVSITGTAPLLFTQSVPQPVGRYLNLIARTGGTGLVDFTMAVDLVVRDS
jgi:hypothetical protein